MDIKNLLSKYENELKEIGEFKVAPGSWGPCPIRNTPITAKENFLRWGRKEKPVFLPFDTDEIMTSPALFPDAIARAFCVDNVGLPPEGPGGKDMFGIEWVYVEQVGGSMVRPGVPLLEDISKWKSIIKFPNLDEWDWEASAAANKDLYGDAYATDVWIMNGLFERLISFMDFEGAAMALIDEDCEDDFHALMDQLASLYEDMIARIKKYYNPDILYFHDDWGSQRSPFFSLDMCREKIAPYLKRVVDAAHKNGMLFNFHSCGSIEKLVPAMIEAGVDIWGGQPMNDFKSIYAKYGREICLEITITPPSIDATEEEVLNVCEEFLNTYTVNGIAIPMIFEPEYHPLFRPLMYCLSRERFA
ncbi:MAG: uroporphyrinogen decarboxylase family protein [Eubacteriales bacterium]|nr:uroporphyrinogen decarboxylase family protein [Eubacteriales bacterium]